MTPIRALAVAALYVAVGLAWVYGALDSSGGLNQQGENGRMVAATLGVLGLLHVVAGYLGRGIWVLALPAVLAASVVPAGDFPTSRPEYPIWFGLSLLAPVFLVLTAAGMLIARFVSARDA